MRPHLVNSGWLPLTFEMTKSFFLGYILFRVRMFTLHLRCYLIVALYLISPKFTTSSLAMHEHLVSVVFKRLRNFASLALNTLVRMVFVVGEPLIGVAALSLALPIDIYRSFTESKIRFIIFLTDRFLIFHKKIAQKFLFKKMNFQMKFLH